MIVIVFERVLIRLSKGISIENGVLFRKDILPGRTSHEMSTRICFKKDRRAVELIDVLFFSGHTPWYHPWIEMLYPYNFKPIDRFFRLSYFDSAIEHTLIALFCDCLPPAGKIFVPYELDDETRVGLMMGVPIMLSRLGVLLLKHGCTWFKDWYFPEGGLEGGIKLQGEKPLSKRDKDRQLDAIKQIIDEYVSLKTKKYPMSSIEKRAMVRGEDLLNQFF